MPSQNGVLILGIVKEALSQIKFTNLFQQQSVFHVSVFAKFKERSGTHISEIPVQDFHISVNNFQCHKLIVAL